MLNNLNKTFTEASGYLSGPSQWTTIGIHSLNNLYVFEQDDAGLFLSDF